MKKTKKFLSIVFLASCISALPSCGGNQVHYDINNFLINGTDENPYQIVKEPVTIKIFAPHAQGNPDFETLKMFKYLEKITNLKFEFTTCDTSAYTNRRAAIWEDSNYKPDLFLFNNATSELVQFQERGFNAYVPFNDDSYSNRSGEIGNVINNYMPNYKKLLENNFNIKSNDDNAKQTAILSDGKMYSTLSVKDVARDLTYKMFINQKWIDNLKEDYPNLNLKDAKDIETIDQYLYTLECFKLYDANRNGDPYDEVPVSSKSLEYLRNFILASYGYVSYGCELENNGSKFTYVPLTNSYREYLKTAYNMWNYSSPSDKSVQNLMDNATFSTTTDSQMAKKGYNGLLGSFSAAAPFIVTGYSSKGGYDEDYEVVGPLTSSLNSTKIHWGFGYFKADGACIYSNSVYTREVARLLDIMYSELGTQLISYGIEGEDWVWDDENHTSWTFLVPENFKGTSEDYRATITPNVNTASALYWSNDFVGKMNDKTMARLNEQSENYIPYLKTPEPSKYKFTSAEYDEISTIKASLDPQLNYLEASYIRGEGGVNPHNDADWAKFVDKVKRYKGERLEEIYNTMLARY